MDGSLSINDLPKNVLWLILRIAIAKTYMNTRLSYCAYLSIASTTKKMNPDYLSVVLARFRTVCPKWRLLIKSKCMDHGGAFGFIPGALE